ncbi:hypothetical protein [Bacillus sp. FJAT-45350]|uniref:hypothetical protein n=1 Tax=Bacillus sp. FJAT-45350 TaxID=2011014 RepID=UPI000BB9446D|nr:hypothetical protein [Bacillus sp. FJAT-45350]
MHRNNVLSVIALTIVSIGFVLFFYIDHPPHTRETLTHFPHDPGVQYTDATTSLKVLLLEDEDEYTLEWDTTSTLDEVAYLRHDISLLFEDGRLKDTMSSWKEESEAISMNEKINGEDSGHYEAISFHHSELHYPNDEIKSRQKMSYDELYIIDSPFTPLTSFKVPASEEDIESKRILDYIVKQQLTYVWEELLEYYNIPKDTYKKIPLTELHMYETKPLPSLDEKQTTKVLGSIWEGIYKHYVLGVSKHEGEVIDPIGSSVPLILLPHENDHFIVVFKTAEGERVQLLQTLSP